MVSYEEALAIAREYLPTIDSFTEYENAFVFGDSSVRAFGGAGQPVVIMKEDGEVLNFVYYIGEYPNHKTISEGSV